jgi:uncharacterized RDD family membrane protein YckC
MAATLESKEIHATRQWWLGEDGQVKGPYGEPYIIVSMKTGKLGWNALACLVGTQEWRTLADWPELRAVVQTIPPPLPTLKASTKPVVYGEFWDRVRALFLDGVILFLFTEVNRYWLWQFGDFSRNESAVDLFYMAVVCVYYAAFESSGWQATPGKKAMGLIVTDLKGRQVSFGRAVVRYFAKGLSFSILLIGFFMAAFTERKQALHDILASCLVVYRDPPSGLRAFRKDVRPN